MNLDSETNAIDTFNLELYFEMSPDLLCIAGYDGYFKRINQTVSKTLGYTKEELLSRPVYTFIHPEDRKLTEKNRQNIVNNIPLLNFENRYLTKTGETVWLSWSSMPMDSEKVVFAIAKIITHKRKADEDRNLLLAKLTKVNSELKQLTYTASHDLRAPVNNLLSVFNLMDLEKIQDPETLEFISVLQSAAGNLKDTLNKYLDILSNEGALQINTEKINLKDCLTEVLKNLKSLIKDSKTRIHADFSAVPEITFNRNYLESIFLNLITNSIKYALTVASPNITIFSQPSQCGNQLIFQDEGIGFDMEKEKGKIFGFKQKFNDHTDNKGIGLYLVHNHITSLGGSITLESKLNEGARFEITFP